MNPDLVFTIANLAALPVWLLMIVAPGWRGTRWLMESHLAPAVLAVGYVIFIAPHLPAILPVLVRPELATIARMLGDPQVAVVAWIHFLAFDLFVGRWEYLDARQQRLPHLLLAPCLMLTLMLGPLGLLCYLLARHLAGWLSSPPADLARKGN